MFGPVLHGLRYILGAIVTANGVRLSAAFADLVDGANNAFDRSRKVEFNV